MDPIRRLLSYATMYVDMDMVPNFLKLWYNFFNKVNSVENIYMMSLDKHVNTCLIKRSGCCQLTGSSNFNVKSLLPVNWL